MTGLFATPKSGVGDWWGRRWLSGCIVGDGGLLWAPLVEPGWQGSSHSATRVLQFSVAAMNPLDLPRNLRTRARRQASADDPRQIPRGPRRRSRARRVARDRGRLAADRVRLDAIGLRRLHAIDPRRPEPGLADGS